MTGRINAGKPTREVGTGRIRRARPLLVVLTAIAPACNDAASPTPESVPDSTGVIRATITTVGVDLPTGYSVVVDSRTAQSVSANDTITISGLRKGTHTISLDGTGNDCTLGESRSQSAVVVYRDTTRASFNVTCWGSGVGSTELAFVRSSDVYRVKLNGSDLIQLTTDRTSGGDPAWSPDGRLAYWSARAAPNNLGYGDIYVMNADGSNTVRRTTTGNNSAPAWSPDGRKIAFTSWRADGTGGDVYVVSADDDGASPVRLTSGCYPVWSPDGGKIAFSGPACDQQKHDDIHVMNADGTDITRLTNADSARTDYVEPIWSPDGRRLAVSAWDAGGVSVVVMSSDGTGLRSIAGGIPSSWSARGRIIAYTVFSRTTPPSLYGVAEDGSYRGLILANAYYASWRP